MARSCPALRKSDIIRPRTPTQNYSLLVPKSPNPEGQALPPVEPLRSAIREPLLVGQGAWTPRKDHAATSDSSRKQSYKPE